MYEGICRICDKPFKSQHPGTTICARTSCAKERKKEYLKRPEMKERARQRKLRWYKNNPEVVNAWKRRYYYRHRDRILAQQKARRNAAKQNKLQDPAQTPVME